MKRCKEKATGRYLAAKFVSIIKAQERKDVLNEIEIMKSLTHPRLIQLYDVYANHKQMCLILELLVLLAIDLEKIKNNFLLFRFGINFSRITGGELFERVIDENFTLTERLCELYVMQICDGINFMHKSNVLHLDMKV